MDQPKRRFPVSLLILAAIAAVFGFGAGLIIVNSRPVEPVAGFSLPTAVTRRLAVNQLAPDFSLNTFSGEPITLANLRGKRVLINFWASWCPPCLKEMPDLVSAYNELRGEGVEFVGIGMQDETAKLKQFVEEQQVPYIIVEDPKGDVGLRYAVLGMPTTVLVDSGGIVRKVFTGAVTSEQVLDEMRKIN